MDSAISPIYFVLFAIALASVVWWLRERARRTTHPVAPGLQPDVEVPFQEDFELYHNALSLCSMKSRLCMAELAIPYKSHHVDLIETGCYENIRPRLLSVNPGGTVPVLVHKGHPVYESHEQIRYAAAHAPPGSPLLVPEDPALRQEMEVWIDRSSLTEDPINHGDESAGNAIPALTLPLFCTMIERIPYWKIVEGLFFHFDKRRPILFIALKVIGIERIDRMKPAIKILARGRGQMARHLDALEEKLEDSQGPWLLGNFFSLADVSWLVILERLMQADVLPVFLGEGRRPRCAAYWARLRERPGYREAISEHGHPVIVHGTQRLREAKRLDSRIRICLEGDAEAPH